MFFRNNKINKILIAGIFAALLGALGFVSLPGKALLAETTGGRIEMTIFYSETCVHCVHEKAFLEELEERYPNFTANEFLISNSENHLLLADLYERYEVPQSVQGFVPISFVGEKYFLGYTDDETTGKEIEDYIISLINAGGDSSVAGEEPIRIPVFGWEIYPSKLSPLPLAIVLGTLDGFNACAMVALGFLLAVLVATGVRGRVIIIGGTFILVSGIVYFLFVAAWLNLLLVSKHLQLITTLVGVVIIVFSIFLLKDYIYGAACKLCEIRPAKRKIFTRAQKKLLDTMKKIVASNGSLPVLLLGVVAVAAGVNSVELVCSFGFPLAFTNVLSDLNLSIFSRYIYILIYILFYMLDDFIIFLIAVFTLKITGVSQKYLKTVKLISAIVLLALGVIMILNPGLLGSL
ncbi:hypothetical protein KJ616_03270 [Patescibacteria group bacterium]|nr:hypothetical protein [Patescibacteria group bacterium]